MSIHRKSEGEKLVFLGQASNKGYLLQVLKIILFLFFSTSAYSDNQKPYAPETLENVTIVSAEQAIDMILSTPGLTVIDARKAAEFHKGHIEGAINLLNTTFKEEDLKNVSPDKSRPILFYCNGIRCLRSSDAIKKARQWGYSNLIWFRGGWNEWSDKGLPAVSQ